MPGVVIHQQMARSGPLPAPEEVRSYELVHPGAAKWIFDQAEKNADHVRMIERQALTLQQLDVKLHRLLPFAVVLAFLAASVIVAFVSPIAGGAGLAATMAGVLTAYLKPTGRAPPPTPPATRP